MTTDRTDTPTDTEALVRRLYPALAAGDADALGALLHPDFVGVTTEGLPLDLGGTHDGPEAMTRDFWWTIGRHYRAAAAPDRFLPLADGGLLVLGRYTGSARDCGAPLDAAFAHVVRVTDGLISSLEQYTDSRRWADALPDAPAGRRALRGVEYGVDAGVATIRLQRPDAGNAIDPTFVEDLYEAVFRAGADSSVRAVLLCGAGRSLSVGGDLGFFDRTPDAEMGQRLR